MISGGIGGGTKTSIGTLGKNEKKPLNAALKGILKYKEGEVKTYLDLKYLLDQKASLYGLSLLAQLFSFFRSCGE